MGGVDVDRHTVKVRVGGRRGSGSGSDWGIDMILTIGVDHIAFFQVVIKTLQFIRSMLHVISVTCSLDF